MSRKKRAPKEVPLPKELADVLNEHRRFLLGAQAPGFDKGWVFPSDVGTLRCPAGLWKAWKKCLDESGIKARFTVHGLRRTFVDLTRRAGVDGIVQKALTGHVTEKMREHYSSIGFDEKQRAVAGVVRLLPAASGDGSGDTDSGQKKTG